MRIPCCIFSPPPSWSAAPPRSGALPILVSRQVSRATYDSMLGLGAGLMLAAATLGLLPEALVGVRVGGVLQLHMFALVLAGFASGVGCSSAWTG